MALITRTCPVCGTGKYACGGHPEITPVDPTAFPMRTDQMMTDAPQLKTYTYMQNGQEITTQLTDADAEKRGLTADDADTGADSKDAAAPDTKARKSAPNK